MNLSGIPLARESDGTDLQISANGDRYHPELDIDTKEWDPSSSDLSVTIPYSPHV